MDATAMGLRQTFSCSSSGYAAAPSSSSKDSKFLSGSVDMGRKRPEIGILQSGFCDRRHLQYYNSDIGKGRLSVMSGKQEKSGKDKPLKKMKKKKQLKLLKGLTKDLSTLTQMGFGLDSDGALLDQVKGNMISEATELLLGQLQKMKAEEKELKRKMKEEKARLKAAARMQNNVDCEMSSSSSSESSDSECGEVIDMNNLKRANATQVGLQQVLEEAISNVPTITSNQPVPVLPSSEEKITLQLSSASSVDTKASNLGKTSQSSLVALMCSKKIEVCMGGKCKKSGAGTLLDEFQRAVGIEGAVSGCKCMGKCRDGPNVKVLNGFEGGVADNSVKAPANSLCIGVGLEDVNMIVANFFSESYDQLSFAAAS